MFNNVIFSSIFFLPSLQLFPPARAEGAESDYGVQFLSGEFPGERKTELFLQSNNITLCVAMILHRQPNTHRSIDGVKGGGWKVTLSFYKSMLREQANASDFPQGFWGISLQEQPNKYYMVITNKRLVTEAGSSIQVIMEKLQSYETRVGLNFEGFQYELGDFLFRVGKVASIHSESLRGIVVEMEYLPISSWVTSHQLMGEFFDIWNEALGKRSLPGHFVHFEPKFSEYGLSDQYTSQHTAVQYASTIAQMIAATESSQAVRN